MSDTIKSQSAMRTLVNEEYRSNYDSIFGERKPVRGSWVWSPAEGRMVPADEYVPPHEDGRTMVVSDLYMDGQRTAEGEDIGSRAKRREYMRRNGVTDASDFAGTWAKAAEERAKFYQGKQSDPHRREALGRALHEAKRRR